MRDERENRKWNWNEIVQFVVALLNIPILLVAVIGGLSQGYTQLCLLCNGLWRALMSMFS